MKKRSLFLLANAGSFLILYLISTFFLRNVYLPGWTAQNHYLYLWVAPFFLDLSGYHWVSVSISLGNLAGVIFGQVMGDFIVRINLAKITPEMAPGQAQQLRTHPGFWIWLGMILLFILAGILLQKQHPEG